ncbi:MAG TPA: aspartyl protease family protein [Vicinamibacterales bacterium]|nr:aspartyl protease family protein [Vicinamibacterales bacterium]HPW21524.1 aspartyl protease family protein [Vicinamibacterales bacterium]
MPTTARLPVALSTLLAAVGLVAALRGAPLTDTPEIHLQLGKLLYAEARYGEALAAFRTALASAEGRARVEARVGAVQAAMRIGDFAAVRDEAARLRDESRGDPEARAVYGDALWSAGLFAEAEAAFRESLAIDPEQPRGHNGLARALMARSRHDQALEHSLLAVGLEPKEAEFHHTLGNVYERLGRYDAAAGALSSFIDLLPKGIADPRAALAGAELRFLSSFGKKAPYEFISDPDRVYTLPFRLEQDKILVRGRVNGSQPLDFVVDTGAELTTISRDTGERERVAGVTYTVSAGVGEVGMRVLQLGRIEKLEVGPIKVKRVPCILKSPALRELPAPEGESLSPLAMGLSVGVDYRRRILTLARRLPDDGPADVTLPLWMNRLATVRGTVGIDHPRSFVVDTGGEVISISADTAKVLPPLVTRKIGLKVFGASGWDRDAYLLPGVDLAFADIRFRRLSVVVLNLRAPSVLLGYDLGGIVGHRFLSRYRVAIDLDRAELRLTSS